MHSDLVSVAGSIHDRLEDPSAEWPPESSARRPITIHQVYDIIQPEHEKFLSVVPKLSAIEILDVLAHALADEARRGSRTLLGQLKCKHTQ